MDTSLIYNIDSNECVGDALSKINSNFLILEALACNLKNNTKNLTENITTFRNASAEIDENFNFILNNYQLFDSVSAVIGELSKYWTSQQLTIYVTPHHLPPSTLNGAEMVRVGILNKKYNASLYPDVLIANVIKTDFNREKWIDTGTVPAFEHTSEVVEVKELSHTIYRYMNVDGGWRYFETINCPSTEKILTPDVDPNNKILLKTLNYALNESTIVVDISAALSGTGGIVQIPSTELLAWNWYLDDESNNLPVTAVSLNAVDANPGSLMPSLCTNAVRFTVKPEIFIKDSTLSSLNIAAYNYTDNFVRVGTTSFDIFGTPAENLFSVNFRVQEGSVEVGSSTDKTITRTTKNNTFTFMPDITIIPATEQYNIVWLVSTPSTAYTLYEKAPTIQIRDTGLTTVTLCAYNVFSSGWGGPKNRSNTLKIYQVSPSAAPDILIYPARAWSTSAQDFIIINSSNYTTICSAPTAYGFKQDLAEKFILSATSGYDAYTWSIGSDIFSTAQNIITANIPYSAGLHLQEGALIQLTANNIYYPATAGVQYKTAYGTYAYPITSSTNNNSTNAFCHNPRIVPYDEVSYTYNLNEFDIDLSKNNKIVATQKFSMANSMLPTKMLSGEIAYTLYNDYWTAVNVLPAVDGTFELFCLEQGDPEILLTVDPSQISTLTLSSCATIALNIIDNYINIRTPASVIVCNSPNRP